MLSCWYIHASIRKISAPGLVVGWPQVLSTFLFSLGLPGHFSTGKLEGKCFVGSCIWKSAAVVVGPLKCFRVSLAPPPLHSLPGYDLSPVADIFILVFLLSRGSRPSCKRSSDLEIVTQTDVQLSVISFLHKYHCLHMKGWCLPKSSLPKVCGFSAVTIDVVAAEKFL